MRPRNKEWQSCKCSQAVKCYQRTKNHKVVDDTSNEEKNEKYLPTSEERRQRNSPQLHNAYCTSHWNRIT